MNYDDEGWKKGLQKWGGREVAKVEKYRGRSLVRGKVVGKGKSEVVRTGDVIDVLSCYGRPQWL